MTRAAFLSWSLLAALGCVTAGSVGCSTPDVEAFDGASAAASEDNGDDDDDDDDDNEPATKPSKSTPTKTTTTPVESKPTPTTPTTPTTPATPAQTPAQCFTKCVATNPAAAAVDTCSNACADGNTDCLGNCYLDNNCDVDVACDAKIKECDGLCPAP